MHNPLFPYRSQDHFIQDTYGYVSGEIKLPSEHGFLLHGAYVGEYRRYRPGSRVVVCWTLDDINGEELLCLDPTMVDDEVMLKNLHFVARQRGVPLLSDIPEDQEGRLMWALKYPDIPLVSQDTGDLWSIP